MTSRLDRSHENGTATWPVVTCTRQQALKDIMATMTRQRSDILPSSRGETYSESSVSGDVVKHRLEELEMETSVLHDLMIARS